MLVLSFLGLESGLRHQLCQLQVCLSCSQLPLIWPLGGAVLCSASTSYAIITLWRPCQPAPSM